MGRLVIKDLNQMCAKGYDLQLRCVRCHRSTVLPGLLLVAWVRALGWSQDFDSLARRFPCEGCRSQRVEWGFLYRGHGQPMLDLSAVARQRRDGYMRKARFWHDMAMTDTLGRRPRFRR